MCMTMSSTRCGREVSITPRRSKCSRVRTCKIAALDWRFNAWAKYDNYRRDDQIPHHIAKLYGMETFEPRVEVDGKAQRLVLEQAIGVSGGHAETCALVEDFLRQLEGEPQPITDVSEAWLVHQERSEQSAPLGPALDTTTFPSTDRSH